MIDKSGTWWKGDDVADLVAFLDEFTSREYRASEYRQSRCAACAGTVFGLVVDDDDGCAQRVCRSCGDEHFIADSAEYWDDADPGEAACPCEAEDFEVVVAYSLREDGDVKWITVGGRCTACGLLGAYTDWKIDYGPTSQLFDQA